MSAPSNSLPPLDAWLDVLLELSVVIGTATRPAEEVLRFGPGSVIECDGTAANSFVLRANGKLIARGELLADGDRLALRIVEIVKDTS